MLRALYLVTLIACVLPTFLGLIAVFFASFSLIPSLSMLSLNFQGFADVFAWHGLKTSVALTIFTSLFSTYLACLISFAILQACWGKALWSKVQWMLSPLLSFPHVAFAIGFAFLFSPTGLFVRFVENTLGSLWGNDELPFLVQDPYGLGLSLMLAIKEVPFLLLMSMSVLKQLNLSELLKVSSSLGYQPHQSWWKVILPLWFVKMRFSIFAVLAYGLSVVDVAIIIGPSNPPTFAVLIWQWFNDADLNLFPRAAAGACLMLLLALFLMGVLRLGEWFIFSFWRRWQVSGRNMLKLPGSSLFAFLSLIFLLILPVTIIWSLAKRWRFPELLPSALSFKFWQQEWGTLAATIEQSLVIALISASIALVLAVIAHEYREKYRWHLPDVVIAIPMLIPQLCVLLGIQITALSFDLLSYFNWIIWAHVFFAFPYVYLSLDGAWRAYDLRLTQTALSLGKSPLFVWYKIKLPNLLPAVVIAWSIGASVSLAQYLPTLMLGAGRISTITTEAVALSSGFDRRLTAIYALWQAFLPLIFFSFAILFNAWQEKFRFIRLKQFFRYDSFSQKPQHP